MTNSPPDFPPEMPPEVTLAEGWEDLGGKSLPRMGVLSMMTEASVQTLAQYGSFLTAKPGELIMTEGQENDKFCLVVDGLLEVFVLIDGGEYLLAHAETGECLGESALLEPGPASASARVVQDAILWTMDAKALRKYLSEHVGGCGAFLMGMAQCLSQRLRNANHLLLSHFRKPTAVRTPNAMKAIHAPTQRLKKGLFSGIFGSSGEEKRPKIPTEIRL